MGHEDMIAHVEHHGRPMPPLKLIPIAVLAVASFVLAIASVTVVLQGGDRACRGSDGPATARAGETAIRETSWVPPGTRCVFRGVGGATRTVEPSPFIFIINLGLGTLLLLVVKRRFVDQVRRRSA